MKIIVDAMSGDNGPKEIVEGFVNASQSFGVQILFVGDESVIKKEISKYKCSKEKLSISHASEVIENSDDPVTSIKQKKDSSILRGLELLANSEGDVFISAGNTGALVIGSSLVIKRIKGVRRIAFAPVVPCQDGCFLLIDVGANSECTPQFLLQFGYMGHIYMKHVMEFNKPRVGLLNIGEEDNKGTVLTLETNKLLKNAGFNYVGNIEARAVPLGYADVVICDGFTGNVVLKLLEGTGEFLTKNLAEIFKKNTLSKMCALLLRRSLKDFKKKIDYKEYGGSPILGLNKHVIKAHGDSDARSFYHAARQAIKYSSSSAIEEIKKNILKYSISENKAS